MANPIELVTNTHILAETNVTLTCFPNIATALNVNETTLADTHIHTRVHAHARAHTVP